jgi:TPR repeat protein
VKTVIEERDKNRGLCPFCRAPPTTSDRVLEHLKKCAKANDAIAIRELGCKHYHGSMGFPQDYDKAMEIWLRAGELGYAVLYYNVANAYYAGEGVERDEKKAKDYYELAAMGGDVKARHNLDCMELKSGKTDKQLCTG